MKEIAHLADNSSRRLLLPVLLLSHFLTSTSMVFSSTLLVDVADSFQVSIGTASQLSLVVSLVGLVLGFTMGALTLRFKHKALFLTGLALYGIGALGFYFAPNFDAALIIYLFSGLGVGIIGIMIFSLIGDLFPLEKRGWIVGLIFSVSFAAFVVVGPLFGIIAEIAGWRSVLLWFSFPLSMVCIVLGLLIIPSKQLQELRPAKSLYSEAFKLVLLNKSAFACLVGTTFLCISTSMAIYAVSFYRVFYEVTPSVGGNFGAIAAAGGIFGAAVGGKLVNRCGRKTLTIVGAFISGVFCVLFTFVPDIWVSVAFWAISATFAAVTLTAFSSLILEQVPRFRSSMMSVNGTFQALGGILGLIIGGLVLNLYVNNFPLLMTIFGFSSIALAVIIFLFAKDPCKTSKS